MDRQSDGDKNQAPSSPTIPFPGYQVMPVSSCVEYLMQAPVKYTDNNTIVACELDQNYNFCGCRLRGDGLEDICFLVVVFSVIYVKHLVK